MDVQFRIGDIVELDRTENIFEYGLVAFSDLEPLILTLAGWYSLPNIPKIRKVVSNQNIVCKDCLVYLPCPQTMEDVLQCFLNKKENI